VQLLREYHERSEMAQPDIRKRHNSIVEHRRPSVNTYSLVGGSSSRRTIR
jgi:hypothetical protein